MDSSIESEFNALKEARKTQKRKQKVDHLKKNNYGNNRNTYFIKRYVYWE